MISSVFIKCLVKSFIIDKGILFSLIVYTLEPRKLPVLKVNKTPDLLPLCKYRTSWLLSHKLTWRKKATIVAIYSVFSVVTMHWSSCHLLCVLYASELINSINNVGRTYYVPSVMHPRNLTRSKKDQHYLKVETHKALVNQTFSAEYR